VGLIKFFKLEVSIKKGKFLSRIMEEGAGKKKNTKKEKMRTGAVQEEKGGFFKG